MEWTEDIDAVDAFDEMLRGLESPLVDFLNSVHPHAEQTPQLAMLFTLGKFVVEYGVQRRGEGVDPILSMKYAMAVILNDPTTQQLVSTMMAGRIHEGVGGQ